MLSLFQNVINKFADVKSQITEYVQSLIFLEGRKNCAAMARKTKASKKRLYKSFQKPKHKARAIRNNLVKTANETRLNREKRVLVIDITCIGKMFARKIEELAVDYDGVLKDSTPGLFLSVCALVTGGNTLPIDFMFWKNVIDKIGWAAKRNKNFKSKIDQAIELITAYKDLVFFDYVAMDGAYCSEKMLDFLYGEKLDYTMRIPRDRVVTINNKTLKIKNQPALKLIRNERSKSAKGYHKGYACTLTVNKRKLKSGRWEVVFIISNMNLSAKEHVIAYARRWGIEKMFRSMKQYLGLKDCQMVSSLKQRLHIFNVFLAYSIATVEKIANKKKSVEEMLKFWRNSKLVQKFCRINDSAAS
jgi:hypothetical protein